MAKGNPALGGRQGLILNSAPVKSFAMVLCTPAALVGLVVVPAMLSEMLAQKVAAGVWWLFFAGVAAAIGMVCWPLYISFRSAARLQRWRARVCLLFSALTLALGAVLSEKIPVPIPPDKFQSDIRLLLKRRHNLKRAPLRGSAQQSLFKGNDFGFPDRVHHYQPAALVRRVVFIGDSFLEVRSTENLPQRVEKILGKYQPCEVINLSESNTGPIDYRFRLEELALQYKPDLVVVNLYEANDLSVHYRHQDYRPRPFQVPTQAVDFVRRENFAPQVVEQLLLWQRSGKVFANRQSFVSSFLDVPAEKRDLVYLVCLAYSNYPAPPTLWLGNSRERLKRLARIVVDRWSKLGKHHWPNSEEIRERAVAVYDLPRPQRLSALCELLGPTYFGLNNGTTLQRLIEAQGQEFVDYCIECPDQWHYFLAALRDGLAQRQPESLRLQSLKPVSASPQQVEQAVQPNLELLREMVGFAKTHGVALCFVLTPEASSVDPDFQAFWRGLTDFQDVFADEHLLFSKVGQKLPSLAPTLDLSQPPQLLKGGYWKYDGHWNERGNERAALAVARFVEAQFQQPQSSP